MIKMSRVELEQLVYRWKIGRPGMSNVEIGELVAALEAAWEDLETAKRVKSGGREYVSKYFALEQENANLKEQVDSDAEWIPKLQKDIFNWAAKVKELEAENARTRDENITDALRLMRGGQLFKFERENLEKKMYEYLVDIKHPPIVALEAKVKELEKENVIFGSEIAGYMVCVKRLSPKGEELITYIKEKAVLEVEKAILLRQSGDTGC